MNYNNSNIYSIQINNSLIPEVNYINGIDIKNENHEVIQDEINEEINEEIHDIIHEENIQIPVQNEKIIIPKKNYYCINCNKKGHTFKNCLDSIISNGIIGIYIENFNKNQIPMLEDYIIKNLRIFNKYSIFQKNKNSIWLENLEKLDINNNPNNKIKFLMVQRKNSLGYLEFIRGRYTINEPNTITHLVEQMSPFELDEVLNKDFDYLWNNLWDKNNIRNKNHHKEYNVSKQKFYDLRINHNSILSECKVLFNFNEWGFPKGRREAYESDLVCAIREFEEETCYNENKYVILEKCRSIRENLIGTNGIGYAHNYFLSILLDKNENHDDTDREIGNIRIMDINECIEVVRPYHKNKIKIIKYIYNVINDFLSEHC